MILHAGLVALRLGGTWRGGLILGPSGAGKSDLALRALAAGFRLVADDRVIVWRSGEALYGRAPEPLAGLIEARSCGILAEPALPLAEIVLAVETARPGEAAERWPEAEPLVVADFALPRRNIDPFEASAPAKLRRALQHLGAARQQAYQARSCGGGDRIGTGDTH
jgi:serine kinase of HPr protein (carbohydrate metabolism regulator)